MKYVQSCIFINWSIYVNSFKLTTKERFDKSLLSQVWQLQVILFNTPLPIMAHYHLKPQFNTPKYNSFSYNTNHTKSGVRLNSCIPPRKNVDLKLEGNRLSSSSLSLIAEIYKWLVPMYLFKYRLVLILSSFTTENEAITILLDHFWTNKGVAISTCRPKLSVSPFENQLKDLMNIFPAIMTWAWFALRDVMTTMCNVSRSVALRIVFWIATELPLLVLKLVPVIQIVLMDAMDVKTQFAFAM